MERMEEKADWVIRDNEKPWPSGIFYSAPSLFTSTPPLRPELKGVLALGPVC